MRSRKNRSNISMNRGFTLVELCFVMIMAGLMLVLITQLYTTYIQSRLLVETREKQEDISISLSLYLSTRGAYPCPADPTLPINDPQAGVANCGLPSVNSARDINNDGALNDPILIGAVPFRTIREGIEQDICYDGVTGNVATCGTPGAVNPGEGSIDAIGIEKITDAWGRRMTYAVTQGLTAAATYRATDGGITVQTEPIGGGAARNLTTPPDSAHYVLVSHGNDGVGGRNPNGQEAETCTSGSVQDENCNNNNTFVSALRRLGASNLYFDDVVFFSSYSMSELWRNSSEDTIFNVNTGNVGIGVTNPTARLHVRGDIKADSVRSNLICEDADNETSCFPPDLLSGQNPCMKCPLVGCVTANGPIPDSDPLSNPITHRYGMKGIKNGHAICEEFVAPKASQMLGKSCPAGQFMTGVVFKANLNTVDPVCVPAP